MAGRHGRWCGRDSRSCYDSACEAGRQAGRPAAEKTRPPPAGAASHEPPRSLLASGWRRRARRHPPHNTRRPPVGPAPGPAARRGRWHVPHAVTTAGWLCPGRHHPRAVIAALTRAAGGRSPRDSRGGLLVGHGLAAAGNGRGLPGVIAGWRTRLVSRSVLTGGGGVVGHAPPVGASGSPSLL